MTSRAFVTRIVWRRPSPGADCISGGSPFSPPSRRLNDVGKGERSSWSDLTPYGRPIGHVSFSRRLAVARCQLEQPTLDLKVRRLWRSPSKLRASAMGWTGRARSGAIVSHTDLLSRSTSPRMRGRGAVTLLTTRSRMSVGDVRLVGRPAPVPVDRAPWGSSVSRPFPVLRWGRRLLTPERYAG